MLREQLLSFTGTAESARHQHWTSLKEKADSSDNFIHGTKRDISTVNRLQGVLTWIGGCGRTQSLTLWFTPRT